MGNNCPCCKSKNPNNNSEETNNSNSLETQNIYQKNIINNDIKKSNNPDNDNFVKQNIETNNNNENKIYIKQTEPILVGLVNLGSTDYMNATLQCLSNTTKLTDYFLERYIEDRNNLISNEYCEVIENLWNSNNNNSSYSPKSFKDILYEENPLFERIVANDPKNLINFLLDRFQKELNKVNEQSVITNQEDDLNENKMLILFLNDFKSKYSSVI